MSESIIDERSDQIIRAWKHDGIDCAMLIGPMMGVNGYVRVPEGVELSYDEFGIVDLDVHGGITYGPDSRGWIGFDTAHAFDAWLDPEIPQSRYSKTLEQVGLPPESFDEYTKIWTLEKMEAEVNRLATQVTALERS